MNISRKGYMSNLAKTKKTSKEIVLRTKGFQPCKEKLNKNLSRERNSVFTYKEEKQRNLPLS